MFVTTQFRSCWRIRGSERHPGLSRISRGESQEHLSDPSQCTWDKPCGEQTSLSRHYLGLKHFKSAVMAGLKVVPVKSLPDGSLDLADLRTKAEQHKDNLAAFMVSIAFASIRSWSHSVP